MNNIPVRLQKASKQYKTFAIPNKLTELETYFYYLLEFDVIPKRISADKIEEIFIHTAKDYLENLLDTSKFATISFHLMTYMNKGEYKPVLSKVLDYCYELDESLPEEVQRVKELLKLYISDHNKFTQLYESGTMDKIFIK